MNASCILALAIVSAASPATGTAAHAVLQLDVASERPLQLRLIPTGTEKRASAWRSTDCGVPGAAGPVGFVRGPGGLDRSADADERKGDRAVMPGALPLLRTIPRSTFF